MGGIGDGRVGKRLTNDRHGHPINLSDGMARKHRIAKVHIFHVVRHKVDVAVEVLINNFHDPIRAQRELPVAGHDIDAQELAGLNHVLALRPQRRRGALPEVSTIEQ